MNKNEKSLISHALKLYGVQYNDNIKLDHYNTGINVSCRKLQNYSIMLRVYNGIADVSLYNSRNTSSKLNSNIRSFINHWIQYYNFNEKINHVAVCKCSHNTFDIAILCNYNWWYRVIETPYRGIDDCIIYNW